MALSTMNSSAKRMWQKFFLLFRMAVMSPHCSKTSRIISSVAFSGRPPTNTVLHPGGRSLVEGGGRSRSQRNTGVLFFIDWLFTTFTGQKLGLQSRLQTVEQSIFIPTYIPPPAPAPHLTPWQSRFLIPSPPPPNLYFSSSFLHRVAMHVREKDNTC